MLRNRSIVLARARARHESAGAAMFIVAVTLGLLAAVGVYGLSATAMDVRAAGHMRESAQAQSAAEHAVLLTAETFTPGTAGELVRAMQGGQDSSSKDIQTTSCKTAKKYSGDITYRAAEACLSLSGLEMENISKKVNAWSTDAVYGTFTKDSFGQTVNHPYFRVEVTNPVDIPPPPGSGMSDRYVFTQVTATVFVDMKTSATATTETVAAGRGRLTVGPYFR